MKRILVTGLFLFAVLLMTPAQPVSACMNDREVEAVEREFETNYNRNRSPLQVQTETTDGESRSIIAMSLGGGGILLMIGGAVLILLGTGKQE